MTRLLPLPPFTGRCDRLHGAAVLTVGTNIALSSPQSIDQSAPSLYGYPDAT